VNIGEELAVLPKKLIYNIMIPTMVLAHTLFFGISSRPVDKNSPMFRLMDKKWPETGKSIIKSIIFHTICESCRRRGMTNCDHEAEDPWSSELQNKKVKYLMGDDKTSYRREMRNEDVDDENEPAFPYEAVMALGDYKWDFGGTEEQDYVYVGIDAAAGGAKSMYAFVSMIMPRVYHKKTRTYRRQLVVCLFLLFYFIFIIIYNHFGIIFFVLFNGSNNQPGLVRFLKMGEIRIKDTILGGNLC